MAASHFGSKEQPARHGRWRLRKRRWHARWRQNMAVLAGLMGLSVLLLAMGWGIDQYRQNLLINLGADLIGAIVTIFVIAPIVSRAGDGRVREHPRLDYAWYVDRVAGATSAVRIMDTFSNLLDGPHTVGFFQAVERALDRQAVVQILLLDPESLAARQRAHELDDPDVYREIMRNLRVLYDFQNTVLPVSLSRTFNVRMYNVLPSITVYRWDEKALVSFFPVGKISSQGVQLEVTVGSPLGQFVNERFNSLWAVSKELERFMRLTVTLVDDAVANSHLEVKFVQLDGRLYASDSRLVTQMARRRAGGTLVYLHDDHQVLNELILVDEAQPEPLTTLKVKFQEKYGHSAAVFIHLEPVIENNLHKLVMEAEGDTENP